MATSAKNVNRRKRKAKGWPDTVVGACGNQVTMYRRLAPKPDTPKPDTPKPDTHKLYTPRLDTPKLDTPRLDTTKLDTPKPDTDTPKPDTPRLDTRKPHTSNSRFTGAEDLFEWDGEPEIQEFSPCQPDFTLWGATPTVGASVRSGEIPTNGALSGSIPVPRTGETGFTDHSVRGEEVMLHVSHLAPDAWGLQAPIHFPSQYSDFRPADASAHLPNILSPSAFHSDRQLSKQGWIQDAASSLATCPWRSHAEVIMSIDLAISNISQTPSSTTVEPLPKEGLRILLDQVVELKRTYFNLQRSVQHPRWFSGGRWAT